MAFTINEDIQRIEPQKNFEKLDNIIHCELESFEGVIINICKNLKNEIMCYNASNIEWESCYFDLETRQWFPINDTKTECYNNEVLGAFGNGTWYCQVDTFTKLDERSEEEQN